MLRLLTVFLALVLAWSAAPARAADDPALPPITADGSPGPLTVDQLSPAERAEFDRLAPGSPEASRFLHTRGFLRYARRVVDGTLPAASLPDLPAREDWDRRYLTAEEVTGVVDPALQMRIASRLGPPQQLTAAEHAALPGDLPAFDPQGRAQPLRPEQLTAAERADYAALAPGSVEARQFLHVRGFLRYARLVVDGKLAPAKLPDLPDKADWDRRFASPGEIKDILDPALAMKIMSMFK